MQWRHRDTIQDAVEKQGHYTGCSGDTGTRYGNLVETQRHYTGMQWRHRDTIQGCSGDTEKLHRDAVETQGHSTGCSGDTRTMFRMQKIVKIKEHNIECRRVWRQKDAIQDAERRGSSKKLCRDAVEEQDTIVDVKCGDAKTLY
ncbi:hypothetical protein PoB_007533400 [Plakobranchus ocellatus]|uniref:Uncharacterized protein n=1 Tax=Plakobranchus ocellatus TaxID=259542 RepID=A0AAV4DXM1_9GAST|nr:hypothetical protein PoB_007533400 [Plakobranchus ocellatus]